MELELISKSAWPIANALSFFKLLNSFSKSFWRTCYGKTKSLIQNILRCLPKNALDIIIGTEDSSIFPLNVFLRFMVFIIPCPNSTETSYTQFTKMLSLRVSTQEFSFLLQCFSKVMLVTQN